MTISTAGMIEAIRIAAKKVETQEEQDCLNLIAIRIDTLTVANTSMSLELNSIRKALQLPAYSSVQAGTVTTFCRLQRELQEVTALANRQRRTAKEFQEENQQLRSELAAYKDGDA